MVDLNGAADSWRDGASTLNLIIPFTAASGVYNVTSVDVTDGAGNVATYNPAQLAGMGFATSLTIIGGQHGAPRSPSQPRPSSPAAPARRSSPAGHDTVALSSVNIYNGATLIGCATMNATAHSWTYCHLGGGALTPA